MPSRGHKQLGVLLAAKELIALGARLRTVQVITGIPPRQAQRLFCSDVRAIPRGRAPASPDWYFSANVILRTDACVIASRYRQLRGLGLEPHDALIMAYRRYRDVSASPARISLDRAFSLVSHVEGIWLVQEPSLAGLDCRHCRSGLISPCQNG